MPARDVMGLLVHAQRLEGERLANEAEVLHMAIGTAIASAFGEENAAESFNDVVARLRRKPTKREVLERIFERLKEKQHA